MLEHINIFLHEQRVGHFMVRHCITGVLKAFASIFMIITLFYPGLLSAEGDDSEKIQKGYFKTRKSVTIIYGKSLHLGGPFIREERLVDEDTRLRLMTGEITAEISGMEVEKDESRLPIINRTPTFTSDAFWQVSFNYGYTRFFSLSFGITGDTVSVYRNRTSDGYKIETIDDKEVLVQSRIMNPVAESYRIFNGYSAFFDVGFHILENYFLDPFVKLRMGMCRWQSDDPDIENGKGPLVAYVVGFNLFLTKSIYFHFEVNETHYYLQSNMFSNRRLINKHYALGISYLINMDKD